MLIKTETAHIIYSWGTRKEADGTFTGFVTESISYKEDSTFTHTTTCRVKTTKGWSSRARAKTNAVQWMRYLSHQTKQAVAA